MNRVLRMAASRWGHETKLMPKVYAQAASFSTTVACDPFLNGAFVPTASGALHRILAFPALADKVLDASSFQGLFLAAGRLAGTVRRNHRHTSLTLTYAAVLGLAVTAAGRDPAESFLRQGTKLLDRGLFADSVAMFTRALEQNPQDLAAFYYRALANEMVDRQAAIGDWRRFAELAAQNSDSNEEVTQARERLHALEMLPELPDSLRPSRYVPKAGDYFQEVAGSSVDLLWTQFPVMVFAESPPDKWQRPLKDALDAWNNVLPLRQVAARQEADIIISWASLQKGNMGTERSSTLVRIKGDKVVKRQKMSSIILDNSHRWSEPQMRFTLLHELGHALGIKGHSARRKDVMFPKLDEMFEESVRPVPGLRQETTQPVRTLASTNLNMKLTPRDINTLVRLYNCPGPVVHLHPVQLGAPARTSRLVKKPISSGS